MNYNQLHIDDEVYWTDPEGLTSGIYNVTEIGPYEGELTIISISNGDSDVDVYLSELS